MTMYKSIIPTQKSFPLKGYVTNKTWMWNEKERTEVKSVEREVNQ